MVGCASIIPISTNKVVGEYVWHGTYGVGASIKLNADHTFQYEWETGLIGGTTYGAWEIDHNRIILNSYQRPPKDDNQFFVLAFKDSVSNDSVTISILNESHEPLPLASIILKRDSAIISSDQTDHKGMAKLPKGDADSIIVSYIGYKTIRFPNKDQDVNHFEFKMEILEGHYKYFVDEEWIFRNGKLIDPTGNSVKKKRRFMRINKKEDGE